MIRFLPAIFLAAALPAVQDSPVQINLKVDEFFLDNGLKVLVVERPGLPRVHCTLYWKVGSVNERPGITGFSHYFEHMMFKGTKTIGTKDAARDAELNAAIENAMTRAREIKLRRLEAARLGKTLSAEDEAALAAVMKEYDAAVAEQQTITVKQEFWNTLQANGGVPLNANTSYDRTVYFVELPSNKLELFMWLEADRFTGPVFREFYPEREVVKEERRLRTDSTPTGLIEESFRAMVWQAHPYSWPVIGWMSDIDQYTLADAQRYYDIHYTAPNCTAIFVGDVKTEEVKALAKRYLGRIRKGDVRPDPIVTLEPKQTEDRRLEAEAATNPSIEVAWHGPSQAHKDGTGLDVTMALLRGRTGRLWKSLVEEKKLALSSDAGFWGLRYGGLLFVEAGLKPETKFADAEAAMAEVVAKLAAEGPGEQELRRVKNQMIGDLVRDLRTIGGIANQLGAADVIRDWRDVLDGPRAVEAVTAEDVKRLAKEYLTPTGRNILTIKRKETK